MLAFPLLPVQVNRLQLAEQALLDYQALKDQAQQLRQHSQDLQQQLARVQEAAAAAEGTTQECRKQLAAADCEKAVLMDRIRQLANRASLAESQAHRSRSGGDSSADAIQDRSPEEHGSSSALTHTSQRQQQVLHFELPAACAELNQQVLVLRGQLAEAQGKEERLQVTNASLQERLSRLQVRRHHMVGRHGPCWYRSGPGRLQTHCSLAGMVADLALKLHCMYSAADVPPFIPGADPAACAC
jgi:chromosome segregation ATPase